jgi:transcriptional regulator with XRE-family HTH domain
MAKSLFTERHDRLRELLKETRQKRGLTQIDVAKKVGRPQSFVSKYEKGERRLDVVEFLEVADALGADAGRLLKELSR